MPTYIIRSGENGPVKIGRAGDVQQRLAALQMSNPETLRVIRVIDTPFDSEPAFHQRFAHKSLRGEWFDYDPDMMTFIPDGPVRPGTKDMMKTARKAARDEAQELVREAYRAFRAMENASAFFRRLSKALGITRRRVRAIYHYEARIIEVHELVGLRDFVRRLGADGQAKALLPLPLFEAARQRH